MKTRGFTYITRKGNSYNLVKVKDILTYEFLKHNKIKEEDFDNWLLVSKQGEICRIKFKTIEEALIQAEIKDCEELQILLDEKDVRGFMEKLLVERVEIIQAVHKYLQEENV